MIGAVAALAIEVLGVVAVSWPEPSGRHHAGRGLHAPRFRHHGHHTRRAVTS